MPNAVIPELSGRRHTVDTALKSPTAIRNRIAQLAGSAALLPKSFHALGDKVEGGGMLYQGGRNRSNASVGALVNDYGGKFHVGVEEVLRNNISYLDQQTSQLANTITHKLDVLVMAEITAAVTGSNVVPGHDWGDLGTVGPADDLTPSSELPSADMSAAKWPAISRNSASSTACSCCTQTRLIR